MLRVLHCLYDAPGNPWLGGGGAVRAFELYRRLAGRIDLTLATGNFPGARDEVINGVRYIRLGSAASYPLSRLSYARAATRLLNEGRYDAAIYDFSVYTPIRVPLHRRVGYNVYHLTGPTAHERWGRLAGAMVDRLERLLLRRARIVAASSSYTAEGVKPLLSPGTPMELIGSGVPDTLFDLERREQDYLLYLGRLDLFHKGLDVLLEAAVPLSREFPQLELRIAGTGRDRAEIERRIAAHGLGTWVRMLGHVTDEQRLALLAGARVFLTPSRMEGFGLAAAEAMAAAVPVVATRAGSLTEVVADAGVLVPVEDATALARETAALLHDDARRANLSARAREHALAHFRWAQAAEAHYHFLERVAALPDRPS